MLLDIGRPLVSYALTSGPTAPEATSFEPVDTTDMVNIATGDLTYNIPLLHVPGPSGGYPLALSYHAGIQPGEESSWVGLGWSLNPGAIARTINGFADDFNDVASADRMFWEGGETRTFSVGISVGKAGLFGATAALQFSQDTYQGFGIGVSSTTGLGFGSMRYKMSAGVSPYGGSYSSAGISMGVGMALNAATSVGASLSIPFDGSPVTSSAGVKAKQGPLGMSAGTSGVKASLSVAGAGQASISSSDKGISASLASKGITAGVTNSRGEKAGSKSFGLAVPIPIAPGLTLSLGYNYRRYWIDETENVSLNGALYFPKQEDTGLNLDTEDFDVFYIHDGSTIEGVNEIENPARLMGGSFPDYDHYNVNAQGITGNIRPYHFKSHLYKRNDFTIDQEDKRTDHILTAPLGTNDSPVHFRFQNDFSNKFIYEAPEIRTTSGLILQWDFAFDNTEETGLGGYNHNHLAGSRHVEHFTNGEIKTLDALALRTRGFIETTSAGFDRSSLDNDQIGAFTITNESGVSYHFSLPANSYSEIQFSGNIDAEGGDKFNTFSKPEPYAYTWFMTGVTGPDYVDRGPGGTPNGVLDAYDWGYWVSMEYGKWTSRYRWRNPGEGKLDDLDSQFKNFSKGKKEVYYLDAIKTKTHTALFVKEIRADAKGATAEYDEAVRTGANRRINYLDEGGYRKLTRDFTYEYDCAGIACQGKLSVMDRPVSSLKLSSIYLLKNQDLPNSSIRDLSQVYDHTDTYTYRGFFATDPSRELVIDYHLGSNVIDIHDLVGIEHDIVNNSLKSLHFDTDYSLTPNIPNSFYSELDNRNQTIAKTLDKGGRLTLNGLKTAGKGGVSLIPGTRFFYDETKPKLGRAFLSASGERYRFPNGGQGLEIGEILHLTSDTDGSDCYGFIDQTATDYYYIKINSEEPPADGLYNWRTTKNPEYLGGARDLWGLYKSDFQSNNNVGELAKLPTPISARSMDAWSLREILTNVGASIKINYEPDIYTRSVMENAQHLIVSSLSEVPGEEIKINFSNAYDLRNFLRSGIDHIRLNAIYQTFTVGPDANGECGFTGSEGPIDAEPELFDEQLLVTGVGAENVRVRNNRLLDIVRLSELDFTETGCVQQTRTRFIGADAGFRLNERFGGGLRVAAIEVEDHFTQTARVTKYSYTGTNGRSSGVTSYEPFGLPEIGHFDVGDPNAEAFYRERIYRRFQDFLTLTRFVPAPGVLYQRVKVEEEARTSQGVRTIPGYSIYQFEAFDKGMVDVIRNSSLPQPYDGLPVNGIDQIKKSRVSLKDYSLRTGSLKNLTFYDQEGRKISETINHYLHDNIDPAGFYDHVENYEPLLDQFDRQGVIQETFTNGRVIINGSLRTLAGLITKKENYPIVQTGQTNINHKTGISTTSTNLAFDFYTGAVTETLTQDGYGNHYLSITRPAYRVPGYESMGLKVQDHANKHMLTQEAASTTYKVDPGNPTNYLGLLSATAQTWSDQVTVLGVGAQTGIWRERSSYQWSGDNADLQEGGTYPISQYRAFDGFINDNPTSSQWQKQGEATLYDVYSHGLEARDINQNHAATKFSSDQVYIFSTVANAKYNEFTFSGAEDDVVKGKFGGDVTHGGTVEVNMVHTGLKSVLSSPGQKGFGFASTAIEEGRTYHASVWSSSSNGLIKYKINNGATTVATLKPIKKAGDWYLLRADIPTTAASGSIEVWSEANGVSTYFDDFRFHPLDAVMTSYVYNSYDELTHILDANNLYTEFTYDAVGRLKETKRETFDHGSVRMNLNEYHYARQNK